MPSKNGEIKCMLNWELNIVFRMWSASYLEVLTYYCVRQKCYRQLAVNCIVIVLWIVIFVVQFGILPRSA